MQCTRGPAPPYEQCHLVAYNLFATLDRQTFGSIGDPTVDNPLPQEFTSCKSGLLTPFSRTNQRFPKVPNRECAVRVSIPPAMTETASWYNIWEAVDAATQICVPVHLVGKFSGIGKWTVSSSGSVNSWSQAITVESRWIFSATSIPTRIRSRRPDKRTSDGRSTWGRVDLRGDCLVNAFHMCPPAWWSGF